jgi:two-component system, NtrC family, response regulator AtoC
MCDNEASGRVPSEPRLQAIKSTWSFWLTGAERTLDALRENRLKIGQGRFKLSQRASVDVERWAEAFGDAVLRLDARGAVCGAAGACEPLFGFGSQAILGKRVDDLVPAAAAGIHGRLGKGPTSARLEADLRHTDGRRVSAALYFEALDDGALLAVRGLTPAEAELVSTNRFLDAVVENIPDMIFVKEAEQLLFQRFNRAGEALLGWTRAELIGKTDHDFYPKEEADFFHLKDRETLAKGELVDIPEEPITTKHAGLRWLHTKKVPIYDDNGRPLYLLGISEDITLRKEAEERAHALERELAAVAENAPFAVVTWSLGGRIETFNPAAEALYGMAKDAAIGSSIELLVPESARAELRGSQERLLAGGEMPPADVYRLRSGFEIEVEESLFALLDAEAKPTRIVSIARDQSELERLRRATEILGRTEALRRPPSRPPRSSVMADLVAMADVVASDSHATVLLLGETGVGKSWLARRVHAMSPRADKPFLEVNCAGLGSDLVESELFGHERGAFTGALSQKRGLVEAAHEGTLFLDEIAELPLAVQAELLTFLDSRSFRRVGGTRALTANVRIIAATNVDLTEATAKGRFRKDLYYRLSVVPLRVPPLRERRDEIPDLARTVLKELSRRGEGRKQARLSSAVLKALAGYDWPGNVRELRNVLERMVILARGGALELEHLPAELRAPSALPTGPSLADMERAHITRVLSDAGGNRTRAAEMLGISRSTLKRKLAELRMEEG